MAAETLDSRMSRHVWSLNHRPVLWSRSSGTEKAGREGESLLCYTDIALSFLPLEDREPCFQILPVPSSNLQRQLARTVVPYRLQVGWY